MTKETKVKVNITDMNGYLLEQITVISNREEETVNGLAMIIRDGIENEWETESE